MIRTKNQLLDAIRLLREDVADDEKKRQKKLTREINKVKELSEEDEDEEGGDKPEEGADEEKSSEDSDEKPEKEKEDKDLPGAKELRDSPSELPERITGVEIVDRINKIRAGASLKDKEVQKRIDGYVVSLDETQQQALWTYLDSLARIVLGGMDSAEVPVPKAASAAAAQKPVKPKGDEKTPEKTLPDLPIVSPVVVGEGVRKRTVEVDVPVKSGKLVPFGSKSHISDLESRIEDLERIKSYQQPGSESRQALTMAVKALRGQLKAALRRSTVNNPRTQGVPPIVERD